MIQEIQIDDADWDKVIRSFAKYDVFYLSDYVKAFQYAGEGTPILIYGESGGTRAVNVLMKRDIAVHKAFTGKIQKNMYYDLCTPYGYGGFLFEGNNESFQEILNEYENYCQQTGYISEFVRFELMEPYHVYYHGEVETRTHNVVRNLDISMDDIMADFEHKVRKNIKKAVRNGLEIIVDEDGTHLDEFLRIYYKTMERTDANEEFFFSKEFFETLNHMKDNVMYFYVLYEEKIISAELVIYGSKNAYSFLGGTDHEYFSVRPNDFLKYEIIKWAKEKGLKNFILGGGYGSDDGIFRYKKSLAPSGIVDFYIGRRIFNQHNYYELVKIREKDHKLELNSRFFPLYRE